MKKQFQFSALAMAIASSAISTAAFADGRVNGRVSDQQGQVFFEGAIVRINELKMQTATSEDGRFSFPGVPAGTYDLSVSYLGAETVTTQITVVDDETTNQPVRIGGDLMLIENVIVTGQAASANKALNQQRSADHLISVITSDSIGQLPDENVSEALQRVSGVFIERDQGEGRYVGIRGIDSNLNASTINGVPLASPEAGRRSVALDVIPSDLVETLTVTKTLNADMDAEAIGGSIDVKSLSAFDRDGLFYKLSGNANRSDLQGENGYKVAATVTNVFSFDAGDLGVAASYSNQERKFGSENIESDGGWSDDFEDDAGNEFIAHEEFEARDYAITREREGFALNLDFRPSEDTLFYSRYLYSNFSDQEYRNRFEYKYGDGDFPEGNITNTSLISEDGETDRELKDRYEEQEIQSLLLGAETEVDRWTLEAKLGYSDASEAEPNRIDSQFTYEGVAQQGYRSIGEQPDLFISEDGLVPANYVLNEIVVEDNLSEDENINLNLDARYDLNFGSNPGFIKFGVAMRNREKQNDGGAVVYEGDFMEESSWADFAGDEVDYSLGNLGPEINASSLRNYTFANVDQFEINEVDTTIASNNDYAIQEDVSAAYIMSGIDIDSLHITYGIRVEHTEVEASGKNVVAFENEDTEEEGVDVSDNYFESSYTDVLPSINIRYELNEKTILRAAYFQSIGRPSFGDLRPTHEDVELTIEDNVGELVVESAGNPELEPFHANNIDLGIEYYPGGIGALSAGFYYKKIDNFIFLSDIADTVDIDKYFDFSNLGLDELVVDEFVIAQNGSDAEVMGIELAWTKAWDNGLLLQLNGTFSESSADYPERESEDLPLVNQSDVIGNFVVGYENRFTSLRLSTNYQSKRLIELDDEFNDLYEDEHMQLDFAGKFNINESLQVFFNAKNLTDEPYYAYHGDRSRNGMYEEYGRSFELGVTFTNQ